MKSLAAKAISTQPYSRLIDHRSAIISRPRPRKSASGLAVDVLRQLFGVG